MKFNITIYVTGLVLLSLACAGTHSMYPLLAFWGGLLVQYAQEQ